MWKKIKQYFPNRTDNQCRTYYSMCKRPKYEYMPNFTSDMDIQLLALSGMYNNDLRQVKKKFFTQFTHTELSMQFMAINSKFRQCYRLL